VCIKKNVTQSGAIKAQKAEIKERPAARVTTYQKEEPLYFPREPPITDDVLKTPQGGQHRN